MTSKTSLIFLNGFFESFCMKKEMLDFNIFADRKRTERKREVQI